MIAPGMADVETEKRLAAEAAADEVRDGMSVGLGTGTTVVYLLKALGRRKPRISCVATSPATARLGRQLGMRVHPFAKERTLDLVIDGADQVDEMGWLVKGAGGAHTREKIVAAAASSFLVIVSSNKLVERIRPPVPLEVLSFGVGATLSSLGASRLREAPRTPEGNLLADYFGDVSDPDELCRFFEATPGVVGHGLFRPHMVSQVILGRGSGVERGSVDEGCRMVWHRAEGPDDGGLGEGVR